MDARQARCDRTELLVDQCGCAQHRGGQTPDEETTYDRSWETPGPWFTASYHGRCTRCDEPFEPGMRIRSDGGHGWECCSDPTEIGSSP